MKEIVLPAHVCIFSTPLTNHWAALCDEKDNSNQQNPVSNEENSSVASLQLFSESEKSSNHSWEDGNDEASQSLVSQVHIYLVVDS